MNSDNSFTKFAFLSTLPVTSKNNTFSRKFINHIGRVRSLPSIQSSRWKASSIPEPEKTGSSADDDRLHSELQQKVKELFGSRQNVTIDMETDSSVQFNVRRDVGLSDDEQRKAAWSVITSILLLSFTAGVLFTGLYYTGAIHGSDSTDKRYEMPTYGSKSYIDPFDLLEQDRQFLQSTDQ